MGLFDLEELIHPVDDTLPVGTRNLGRHIELGRQRDGSTVAVDLHEAHESFHPRKLARMKGRTHEPNHDICTASMQRGGPDLDHGSNRNRFMTFDVEDSPQHEIRIRPDQPVCCRIGRFQTYSQQRTGIKRPMMIRIDWQNQSMRQRFAALFFS